MSLVGKAAAAGSPQLYLLERGNFAREVLFPDIANFQPPDQRMPEQNRKVAVKIGQGYEITQATLENDTQMMPNSNGMEESAGENAEENTMTGNFHVQFYVDIQYDGWSR